MEDQIFTPEDKTEISEHLTEERAGIFSTMKHNKLILGSVIMVAAVIAVVAWIIFRGGGEVVPSSSNVFLLLKGPAQLTSGNEIELQVTYRNGENADMINASLEIFYPSNFQFKTANPAPTSSNAQKFDLPPLKSGQDGLVKIRGKLAGATSETKQFRAKLEYRLSNFNSQFVVESDHEVLILAPNLTIEITGPIDVTIGQNVTFTVNYTNVSSEDFDNLALQLQYPEGFSFFQSSPPPAKNDSYWEISKLTPGQHGKVEITGSFSGDPGDERLMVSEVGLVSNNNFAPLLSASANFKLTSSVLSITQIAHPSDTVALGETIEYRLLYKNQGAVGMTNVVVTAKLEGAAIDLNRLQVRDAIATGNTLTWKSATLGSLNVLAPNQQGEISFSIPLRQSLTSNVKNQIIKVSAQIASDQITAPVKGRDLEIKLESKLGLSVSGEYVSGSLPMKVGSPTVFALTFLLTNQSNDLSDVEVIASLPLPASSWKNVVLPQTEAGNLFYDSNSGKIRWKAGDIPAFTGKFIPAKSVTFQLEVVPGQIDQNKPMKLLGETQGFGSDGFIGQDVSSDLIREITTATLGDSRVDAVGGQVQ